MDAVEVIYEDTTTLEETIVHMKKAKMNIVSFFLEFYAKEFHRERGAVIQYDNASFLKMLTDTQNYRKGVRAMVETGSDPPLDSHDKLLWNTCMIPGTGFPVAPLPLDPTPLTNL